MQSSGNNFQKLTIFFYSFILLIALPGLCFSNALSSTVVMEDNNIACVTRRIPITLKFGLQPFQLKSIPLEILPTSILIWPPPNTSIQSQQIHIQKAITSQMLAQIFIHSNISILKNSKLFSGQLIGHHQETWILNQPDGKISAVISPSEIQFSKKALLLFKPSFLKFKLFCSHPQKAILRIIYLTHGLSWKTHYFFLISHHRKSGHLLGFFDIHNGTGMNLDHCTFDVLSGIIHQLKAPLLFSPEIHLASTNMRPINHPQKIGENTLYTLPLHSIQNLETKQVVFLKSTAIPIHWIYQYRPSLVAYGSRFYPTHLRVILRFRNPAFLNMHLPLPSGKITVYQMNSEQQTTFLSENHLPVVPPRNMIQLNLGRSSYVTGLQKQVNQTHPSPKIMIESFRVFLKNHQKFPIHVQVLEHFLNYQNWEILHCSLPYQKENAHTVLFKVPVSAHGQSTFTYQVRYWQN
jgi:hypothetical protein